jgi:hypothetical protein
MLDVLIAHFSQIGNADYLLTCDQSKQLGALYRVLFGHSFD